MRRRRADRLRLEPQTPLKILSLEKLNTCAIVGNSGALLGADNGKYIDNHELVVRTRLSLSLPTWRMWQSSWAAANPPARSAAPSAREGRPTGNEEVWTGVNFGLRSWTKR